MPFAAICGEFNAAFGSGRKVRGTKIKMTHGGDRSVD